MIYKKSLIFVFVLFFISFVSAVSTPIKINTAPLYEIIITVSSSETYSVLERYYANASREGVSETSFDVESAVVDVYVQIRNKQLGTEYVTDKLENLKTGELIEHDIYPVGFPVNKNRTIVETEVVPVAVTNNTNNATAENVSTTSYVLNQTQNQVNNTALTTNNSAKQNPEVTGNVISGEGFDMPNYVYYIIGGIVILVIIVYFVRFLLISKGSDWATRRDFVIAEKKLKKAQKEINKLKNQTRIEEMERKIQEERAELSKLRHGD